MKEKIKKISMAIFFSITFLLLVPVSAQAVDVVDGDLIRNPNASGEAQFDVYIAKIVGEKKFKRLILSPHVFESYGHLSWDKIKDIGQSAIDEYETSDLVRCYDPERGVDDPKVYQLTPAGDVGTKQWLNMSATEFMAAGHNWDSIYIINKVDRDAYITGEEIKEVEDELDALLPTIENYPKLKQVYRDMYDADGYSEDEIEFMKIALEIYKEKPELKNYPEEVLYYFAFRFSDEYVADSLAYDNEFFNQTIRQTAKNLKKESDIETAKNIYRWVNNYITNQKHLVDIDITLNDYDLKTIWEYQTGVCLEKAHLITALLKSIGIPAREVSSEQVVHRWSEFYVDEIWFPIPSTGALDSDNDGAVDFRRLTEDAVVKPDLAVSIQQHDIYSGKSTYPVKFIGYKYSVYWAQQILKLAEYNEFVSLSKEYISKWENSRNWEEREEFGRKALSYAIASVFGEEKPMYVAEQIKPVFSVKKDSVILDKISEGGLAANKWSYDPHAGNALSVILRDHVDKEINLILTDKESGEVTILFPDDVKTLSTIAEDFDEKVSSTSILEDFVGFITDLQDNKISKASLTLPKLDYEIFISGSAFYPMITGKEGFTYNPFIIAYKQVKDLEFRFEEENLSGSGFKNIKFLNEQGEQLISLTDEGYLKGCFTEKLKVSFDQILSLKKEGDYVIIQGRMWVEN